MDAQLTGVAQALAVIAAACALTDWWCVWSERRRLRLVAKPATLLALIGVAVTLDPFDATIRGWLVAGLVLSLGGDVALLLEGRWFLVGLVSFLGGHLAYIAALQLGMQSPLGSGVGVVLVLGCWALVGRRIVAAVSSGPSPQLRWPVVAYIVVISAMVASAVGTTAPWAIGGALLFYLSDATLAWNRFVRPLRHGPLAVMVTYHLGQAGLVAWLVTA